MKQNKTNSSEPFWVTNVEAIATISADNLRRIVREYGRAKLPRICWSCSEAVRNSATNRWHSSCNYFVAFLSVLGIGSTSPSDKVGNVLASSMTAPSPNSLHHLLTDLIYIQVIFGSYKETKPSYLSISDIDHILNKNSRLILLW